MDVKIISTGEPCGTRIIGPGGVDLSEHCTGITWTHDAGELPRADVRLGLIEFEVDGEARFVAPNGKAVRRIEYEDGEIEVFAETGRAPLDADRTRHQTLPHGAQDFRYVR